jgi:hypothetical protein
VITYTPEQVRKKLKALVGRYATATEAAAAIGCTDAQISQFLHGHIPACEKILDALGLARVKVYTNAETS